MLEEDPGPGSSSSEDLLRQALLDDSSSVAVSLKVGGLPLSESVTVIFHGRRDLGTLQTYVTRGSRGAGATVAASELLRVPCDLDLADAGDRADAERLYIEQATALRDELSVRLPAHRLLPTALIARESHTLVTPVCGARTLAEGRPPMGIACAQQDVIRIYPLADDPERCVEDFLEVAAEHARALAQRLDHQEASVERFLELSE
jgi:hypothetical protein